MTASTPLLQVQDLHVAFGDKDVVLSLIHI